jgi:hypothetical protein
LAARDAGGKVIEVCMIQDIEEVCGKAHIHLFRQIRLLI